MPGDFQVIYGSMVGENRRSPASTETPMIMFFGFSYWIHVIGSP